MSEQKPKLNPCPFCGGASVSDDHQEEYDGTMVSRGKEVRCRVCPAKIIVYDDIYEAQYASIDQATEAWNRRAK